MGVNVGEGQPKATSLTPGVGESCPFHIRELLWRSRSETSWP